MGKELTNIKYNIAGIHLKQMIFYLKSSYSVILFSAPIVVTYVSPHNKQHNSETSKVSNCRALVAVQRKMDGGMHSNFKDGC